MFWIFNNETFVRTKGEVHSGEEHVLVRIEISCYSKDSDYSNCLNKFSHVSEHE